MDMEPSFRPGSLVRARGREWVVLPERRPDTLRLRPLGGADDDATVIYLPLERDQPAPATFDLPDPDRPGSREEALLLRDAVRLKLRSGAGPFRSFGHLNVEPRAYQLAPLLMALRLDPVRLLIADDVGVGKTIEAGLIARELLDRGEIERFVVICPPHLCEQWQRELSGKFSIRAEVVRTGTATRLERGLRPDESIFDVYPFTVVSLDYIKSDRRRGDFQRACPGFVIVDEAHTCVRANTNTRHQRYELLRGLAESEPRRGMVLLTATPHSGDDVAFHNLLGLLSPEFKRLADLPEGDERRALRETLALHFVQRRRGDIAEWRDEVGFPARQSREATYRLTGPWGRLFDDVLAYARTLVRRAEGATKLEQRMSWWAALALLRCVSSSPAAASSALRTRLRAAEGESEAVRIADLDRLAAETVMDEAGDDSLTANESVPAGTVESRDDAPALRELIDRVTALRGPRDDPKLGALIRELKALLRNGFKPVVFCRYIATARYLGEELRGALSRKNTEVLVVTGELTPDQREERVDALAGLESGRAPVLVATDCLSEGVNLQNRFDAVVHYDLTWNPTRHEQREGRADRFGQASKVVRALMLYGQDNPVDGAVLRVILRKAEKIRKELGVAVPLPADNNKVVDAIMRAVLLHGAGAARIAQRTLDLGDADPAGGELDEADEAVEDAWQQAAATAKQSRTVFAQRRLRPDDVLPEWRKAVQVLGGQDDVARFVRLAAERLGAPLDERNGCGVLPLAHLPKVLQDRLAAVGLSGSARLTFGARPAAGAEHVHRAHPLVATLADYIAEQALDGEVQGPGTRAGAMFTAGVSSRTVLFLMRLRSQIQVEKRGEDGRFGPHRALLAEECVGVALGGGGRAARLPEAESLALLSLEPGRNMELGQKSRLIRGALGELAARSPALESVARERAAELLADHRRIRDASGTRGLRYAVTPALPPDVLGVYVFLPMASL